MEQLPISIVILAGGQAKRLWPLSSNIPKFLVEVKNKRLIEYIIPILKKLTQPELIYVITQNHLIASLKKYLDFLPAKNFIAEPEGKDTALAIITGVTIGYLRYSHEAFAKSNKELFHLILPIDHVIEKPEIFNKCIIKITKQPFCHDKLILLGTKPLFPSTHYGYIKIRRLGIKNSHNIYRVLKFIEKPDKEKANKMMNGNYLWNCGIFLWRTSTFLNELRNCNPYYYKRMVMLKDGLGKDNNKMVLEKVYKITKKLSIEYALLEKTNNIIVSDVDFGWQDAGSWESLTKVYKADNRNNVVIGSKTKLVDSKNTFAYLKNKECIIIGAENLIIAENNNKLLICHKDKIDKMKKVIEN